MTCNASSFSTTYHNLAYFITQSFLITTIQLTMKLQILVTLTISLFSTIDAFGSFNFGAKKATKAPSIPKEAIEEALSIYDKKFPSAGKASANPFWNDWGLPARDLDGTAIKSEKPNRKLFDVGATFRQQAFEEIATLYGTEEALTMTRILPGILAFDSKNFKPSLNNFSEIFGEEEAKAMIMRNPGLLYVTPENAAKADDLTMKFSYALSVTRPAGPLLLYGTLSLLMVPVLEGITGVSRAEFFKSLGLF